jgi:hypothetical protein
MKTKPLTTRESINARRFALRIMDDERESADRRIRAVQINNWIVGDAAKAGRNVLVESLEVSADDICNALAATEAGMSPRDLHRAHPPWRRRRRHTGPVKTAWHSHEHVRR